MKATRQQVEDFRTYALEQVCNGGCQLTIDELYDRWRLEHPSDDEFRDDVLALKASLRDIAAGETGRPIEEFSRDIQARHELPDAQ